MPASVMPRPQRCHGTDLAGQPQHRHDRNIGAETLGNQKIQRAVDATANGGKYGHAAQLGSPDKPSQSQGWGRGAPEKLMSVLQHCCASRLGSASRCLFFNVGMLFALRQWPPASGGLKEADRWTRSSLMLFMLIGTIIGLSHLSDGKLDRVRNRITATAVATNLCQDGANYNHSRLRAFRIRQLEA